MNTIGSILRLTCYGESHGRAVGGVLDGMPARFRIDMEALERFMQRRRPGSRPDVSARREEDKLVILSGISEDKVTLGTPISFMVENSDARPRDYDALRHIYRPNHADFTYEAKYGIREHRGGGRASARATAVWVAGGGIALQWLEEQGVSVRARLESAGGRRDVAAAIGAAAQGRDSVGGIVSCVIEGLPAGVGEPLFDKLQARLAFAMLTINGVHGFEYGDGFALGAAHGSEVADSFAVIDGKVLTTTNHSGGIQGGISNGMPVVFKVAFKPTPTIGLPVKTITDSGEDVMLEAGGRHDACIAVRGTVVVEAMAALAVADAMLVMRAR